METKLSIITINYNNASGLLKTVKSVTQQSNSEFEYIVVDGGSSDNSLEVIKRNKFRINRWISEPDNGVYHAMNKGLEMASGEYVLYLNSGDYLSSADIIDRAAASCPFDKDIIYGNLLLELQGEITEEKVYPDSLSFKYFYLNESLPHPSTFIRRSLLIRAGGFSEHYKIMSDWEFWLKALFLMQATYSHLPIPISVFNLEGVSSSLEGNAINQRERAQVYGQYFSWIIDEYKSFGDYRNALNKNIFFRVLKKLRLVPTV